MLLMAALLIAPKEGCAIVFNILEYSFSIGDNYFQIQVAFKWKDAFDKGTIFGGRISLTVASLGYEKACILFNIAALSTQVKFS